MLFEKFVQWLWFGTSPIPERSNFKVCETKGIYPSLITTERSKVPLTGVFFPQPWAVLKNRFWGGWITRRFQSHYHWSNSWATNVWREVPCYKTPCDLLMYQEIVIENKPDLIIECGTYFGGTALFLADMCDLIGNGSVITLDNKAQVKLPDFAKRPFHKTRPVHPRIHYMVGYDDSDEYTLALITQHITPDKKVMVILDSNHTYEHVKKQLELYAPLVTQGQYLIVEDTNVGWLVKRDQKSGPLPAVREFLAQHSEFYIDYHKERNLLTFNPCGYLRKRSEHDS